VRDNLLDAAWLTAVTLLALALGFLFGWGFLDPDEWGRPHVPAVFMDADGELGDPPIPLPLAP